MKKFTLSSNLKAHVALFCVALIYGANYTIAKEVMNKEFIQPLGFIMLRVVSATILFWIFQRSFIHEKVDRKDLGLLALCGLFGVSINQMFFFSGLKLTQPIHAALIMTTAPILVLVTSAIITQERITLKKIVGIVLGMVGAIYLIGSGKEVHFSSNQMLGDFMILVNATSYSVYLVIVGKMMKKYNALTVITWVFTFGCVFVVPFGFNQVLKIEWNTFSKSIWIAVVYVLLFTTFLAYLFNAYALKIVKPTVVSIYIYLQPLLAGLIAIIWSKDEFTVEKMLAALLIFSGVYLVSRKSQKVEVKTKSLTGY